MFVPLLHFGIIILVWIAPLLVSWKILLLFIGLYYLQLLLVGNCILTAWQFGKLKRDISFYSWLLEKVGFQPNRNRVRIFVDYFLPWILLFGALIWQVWLGETAVFEI